MDFKLNEPGFEGQGIVVRSSGLFSKPKVFIKGVPAKGEKNRYIITDNTGRETVADLKPRIYDIVPELAIDGKKINLAEPLKWYAYTWMLLPLAVLIFFGGGLGALVGLLALSYSSVVFRSGLPMPLRYIFSLIIALCGWAVYTLGSTAIGLNVVYDAKWYTQEYRDFKFTVDSPYVLNLNPADESLKEVFSSQLSAQSATGKLTPSMTIMVESFVFANKPDTDALTIAETLFNVYKNDLEYGFPKAEFKEGKYQGMDAVFTTGSFNFKQVFPVVHRSMTVFSGKRLWYVQVNYTKGRKKLEEYADRVLKSVKIDLKKSGVKKK